MWSVSARAQPVSPCCCYVVIVVFPTPVWLCFLDSSFDFPVRVYCCLCWWLSCSHMRHRGREQGLVTQESRCEDTHDDRCSEGWVSLFMDISAGRLISIYISSLCSLEPAVGAAGSIHWSHMRWQVQNNSAHSDSRAQPTETSQCNTCEPCQNCLCEVHHTLDAEWTGTRCLWRAEPCRL